MSRLLPQPTAAGSVPPAPRARSRTPHVPLEVWVLVVSQLVTSRDFPLAWARCRRVSHAFKKATELAFLGEALPRMVVNLNLVGTPAWGEHGRAVLQFKGLSHGGERVYFAGQDQPLKRLPTYTCPPQAGRESGQPSPDVVCWNRLLPVGGAQSPPMLVEWASFLSVSVCRGPKSYYDGTPSRDGAQYAYFPAGTAPSVGCRTRHKAAEVSFLWKEMLNVSFSRFGIDRDERRACSVLGPADDTPSFTG